MTYWTREIAGWVLMVLGLFLFYRCYTLLTGGNHYILEAGSLTVVGIFLFRGGIHLLKVAVAARVCLDTEQRLEHEPASTPVRPPGAPRVAAGRRFL
jgi:hypothetical protein